MRTFTRGQTVEVRQLYGNLQSATVDGWYWSNRLMIKVTFTESDASGCHPRGSQMHLSPQFLAR